MPAQVHSPADRPADSPVDRPADRPADRPTRAASRTPARRAPRRHPVGLALAGGGFLGAAYELGALAALAEGVDGLNLTELDSYVGVSAGAFIAAGLANGQSAHQMVRMFIDDTDSALDPASILRPATQLLRKALVAAPVTAGQALMALAATGTRGLPASAWDALERFARSMPPGVLDARLIEQTLERLFQADHRTNDFRELRGRLRIVATDIDTGQPVAFGSPGRDHVPISRAVIASAALPGVFQPVSIDGHFFVDGALNKTLHASVALNDGVRLLFCVNPLVPFSRGALTRPGTIAKAGLPVILSQSMRTVIRSRMTTGLEKYGSTHPHASLVVLEPRSDDTALFFTRIFTVSSRRRVCEQAYQHTRLDLLARFDPLNRVLAPRGMRLNRRVLEDPSLTLVEPPGRHRPGSTPLRAATDRLGLALDDLDRALRLARARH